MNLNRLFVEPIDPSVDRKPRETTWKQKALRLVAVAAGCLFGFAVISRFDHQVTFLSAVEQAGGMVLGTLVAMVILGRKNSPV